MKALLEERGVSATYREYLQQPPSVAELEELSEMLGSDDGSELLREKESEYAELGLADADKFTRLAAIAKHPKLLNRPIVTRGPRAVVARPPEKALEILD